MTQRSASSISPQLTIGSGSRRRLCFLFAAAAACALVAFMDVAPAYPADTANGALICNGTPISIRSAVSRWDSGNRELRVMLFTAPPSPEAVKFWTENKGIGIYPSDWGYAAAFTLTFNDAAKTVTPATLRNFHLFVDCPSLQANFNGGGLSARAAEALRQKFPVLEATLAPKGRVRMTAKGADRLELPRPTAVSWDVQVDIPIYAN